MNAKEVALLIKERLNLQNVRLCGNIDFKTQDLTFLPGCSVTQEIKNFDNKIFIVGEICEWATADYVRDAAELGYKKALIILGHMGSEREGMNYLAQLLKQKYPKLQVKYFETEECFFPI